MNTQHSMIDKHLVLEITAISNLLWIELFVYHHTEVVSGLNSLINFHRLQIDLNDCLFAHATSHFEGGAVCTSGAPTRASAFHNVSCVL